MLHMTSLRAIAFDGSEECKPAVYRRQPNATASFDSLAASFHSWPRVALSATRSHQLPVKWSARVLNDAFSYCDSALHGLTGASGVEVIDITQEDGRQTRNLRMGLLTLNSAGL